MTSRATPTAKNPTHAITLSDGTYTYGFELADLPQRAIQDNTATPSTLVVTGGGNKYGNGDPSFSHIEQRDWTGGRGQEDFQDDATRFYDNNNCWTGTSNLLMPSMAWRFSKGIYSAIEFVDTGKGEIFWEPVYGSSRYLDTKITGITLTATRTVIWMKRIGNPSDPTLKIYADSGGAPTGSALGLYPHSYLVGSNERVQLTEEISTPFNFSAATTYHLVLETGADDDADNHWEIGCCDDWLGNNPSKYSADFSTWTGLTNRRRALHRILGAAVKQDFLSFYLNKLTYVVTKPDNAAAAAKVYSTGSVGFVTSAGSDSFTTSVNEANAVGGYVNIVSGTGSGQTRTIIASSGTYMYSVSPVWDTIPDATSMFIITGIDAWNECATTGLTKPVKSVCVADNVAYFAQGSATNIRKMRYDTTTKAHQYADDGSNKADLLYQWFSGGKTVIVRSLGNEISFADLPSTPWSSSLSFGTAIKVGTADCRIINIVEYNGSLWVAKEDGLWFYDSSLKQFKKLNVGLDAVVSPNTGAGMVAQNLYLFFTWGNFSIERLYGGNQYGGTLDDIGLWKGSGLPFDRGGNVASLLSVYSWLFAGVGVDDSYDNADKLYSSVMMYNGMGWSEIFRGWETKKLVRNIFWQSIPDGRNRLWIVCDGELISIVFPRGTLNPAQDRANGIAAAGYYYGYTFANQAIIDTSTYDMGMSVQSKYFHKFSVISDGLNSLHGMVIHVYYQTDDDIGQQYSWTYAGTISTSPSGSVDLALGNTRRIRMRMIIQNGNLTATPVIRATVLEGFVRTPHKRVWVVRTKTSPFQVTRMGTPDTKPSVLYDWLNEKLDQADTLTMAAIYDSMHNHSVIMDQYRLVPKSHDEIEGEDSYELWMTLREA